MGIANQLLNRPHHIQPRASEVAGAGSRFTWMTSEVAWVSLTFVLFMIMGPFAAIAVVPAVLSLTAHLKENPEPETEALPEVL